MEPWVWAVLLLCLGTGLAILEVFFPSAGILGFLSALSFLGAITMGFYQGPTTGILAIVVTLAGLPVVLVLAFKYWPKTAIGRRMLLAAPESEDVLPDLPDKEHLKTLIGRMGKAKSKLLLSGVILVDGRTIDAVSESMPIEVGQTVRIVQVRGATVVVRPIDEEPSAPVDPLQQTYDDPFAS